MTGALPAFRFNTSGMPGDEAFEAWRQIMARMFHIDRARVVQTGPRGGVSASLVGDLLANRSVFNAQTLTRDRHRIEATPDHLVLQLYLSGGFAGEIGGEPIRVARGQIAVCDLRRPLAVEAMTSNTIGLSVPRALLHGIDLDSHPARLEPARERLLAARLTALHRRLPKLAAAEMPGVTTELVDVLRHLFDRSATADVFKARAFDADRLSRIEARVAELMALPDLSPATLAERLSMSRATLYRLLSPSGGVMEYVWTMRLEAVRSALDQPAEPRTLARLAFDHGFKSAAHLSRSFRAHFGIAPRDWRARASATFHEDWQAGSARLNGWWRALGR